ncbi:hypothetical protein NE237_023377 [Protea cynaroides]|uniref:Uncharacterized protein n=1 Tax=Protea cynaroides TaxID=273540 RepID=A0A9Q0K6K2_9MAGN|nr:hypothetical protein NE237_023377 [Protea cynaroides]
MVQAAHQSQSRGKGTTVQPFPRLALDPTSIGQESVAVCVCGVLAFRVSTIFFKVGNVTANGIGTGTSIVTFFCKQEEIPNPSGKFDFPSSLSPSSFRSKLFSWGTSSEEVLDHEHCWRLFHTQSMCSRWIRSWMGSRAHSELATSRCLQQVFSHPPG